MDESSNAVESSTEQSVVEVTSDALISSFDVSDEVFDALELDMYRQSLFTVKYWAYIYETTKLK